MGQNTKSVHCETKIVLQIRLEKLNFLPLPNEKMQF